MVTFVALRLGAALCYSVASQSQEHWSFQESAQEAAAVAAGAEAEAAEAAEPVCLLQLEAARVADAWQGNSTKGSSSATLKMAHAGLGSQAGHEEASVSSSLSTETAMCGAALLLAASLCYYQWMKSAREEEAVPLRLATSPDEAESGALLKENALTALNACVVIALSVGLINFNSWLMQDGHFPYAVTLVFIHMVYCSTVASILILFKPDWFPALSDPEQKITLDREYYQKNCVPIAFFFTISLVLGNVAYGYLSVAFIQMIKESNLIWIYLFSVFFGFARSGYSQVQIIAIAVFGISLAVKGELHFQLMGFLAQLSAILAECGRIIMQGKVLSGGGKKLDPLSYILLICPASGLLLGVVLFVTKVLPSDLVDEHYHTPPVAELLEWMPVLLLNATHALLLNFSIAMLIKRTSPMGYSMCQVVKTVTAVVISVAFVQEEVTKTQAVGFSIELCAVMLWSLLQNFPSRMSGGLLQALFSSHETCEQRSRAEEIAVKKKTTLAGA